MARFYPVYVRRSDGTNEVISKGSRREYNQPTAEQMDQRPDKNGVSDYYRECEINEVKSLDWRRKLGGMLARELQWKDKNGSESTCILAAFPQNYRLYEHIKKSEKDGKTEVKNKTHAAGGNDRQDAYLYGHPAGRRKRYRSPADFFPHLLWLCTDETGDPDNCSCKLCCPEELENMIPGAKAVKVEKPIKVEPEPRQTKAPSSLATKPEAMKLPKQEAIALERLVATPLPQARSIDQQLDSQYTGFKYRQGELCWFRPGQSWSLGIILRRWNTYTTLHYSVQPLSFPGNKQNPVTLSSDDHMRPWLAWSVPRFTYPGLNDITPLPQYETMDWQGLAQGRFGAGGVLDVDGSILAAKSIDSSYTPFSAIQRNEPQPGIVDIRYEGLYLGGEKIWRGEPIRLATGTGLDILVVQQIVERTRQGNPESIIFIGDVYVLTAAPHTDPNVPSPASPLNNPNLPRRLTDDLAYRNARSIQVKGVVMHWKLSSTQTRVDLNNIKGRWYESSLWLPILRPDIFQSSSERGEIQELSMYMNSRGDCLHANRDPSLPKIPRMNIRRGTRVEAFRQAVPANTQIVDGNEQPGRPTLDPALSTMTGELDPRFTTNAAQEDNNIDTFMNLEPMEGQGGYY
ncbi:hypothetical protein AMS68_004831 [Peltaster fructicola]|uniref:Cryptic loci regulator 2 N-terminal domain-containing protein n=1 Tax=Peltaster fructicola TaxID=286661 RepID=A0A6H0XX58_9PEZI|nr:hypothetical protein AMS68_004831 [Peltaster fructicola]